ncbi:hypothetical protein CSUI_000368, partial [Cystoisospora suis]
TNRIISFCVKKPLLRSFPLASYLRSFTFIHRTTESFERQIDSL